MAFDRATESREFAPFSVPENGLVRVDTDNLDHALFLYRLLEERTPEQSISYEAIPTFSEYVDFVRGRPYLAWYLVRANAENVGAIYLTRQKEIGLSILTARQRQGHGGMAVRELMRLNVAYGGPFLANINPQNEASIAFWRSLGFTLKQVTYALSPAP